MTNDEQSLVLGLSIDVQTARDKLDHLEGPDITWAKAALDDALTKLDLLIPR